MDPCADLYLLSAIACRLSECLSEEELAMLSTNLSALGDMLQVILTRRDISCKDIP